MGLAGPMSVGRSGRCRSSGTDGVGGGGGGGGGSCRRSGTTGDPLLAVPARKDGPVMGAASGRAGGWPTVVAVMVLVVAVIGSVWPHRRTLGYCNETLDLR